MPQFSSAGMGRWGRKMRYWWLAVVLALAICPHRQALANYLMGGTKEVLGPHLNRFQIVVKIDSLTVYNVIANKGKCEVDGFQIDTPNKTQTSPPLDADFGDIITVNVGCNATELRFDTNRGAVTLHWRE